jgi:hypothetical protein
MDQTALACKRKRLTVPAKLAGLGWSNIVVSWKEEVGFITDQKEVVIEEGAQMS